jgi:hypothetical protein
MRFFSIRVGRKLANARLFVYNARVSMIFLFMKKLFRIGFFVSVIAFIGVFFASCSQDQSVTVKSYNNSIVQIQKDMFTKAQETSKVFEAPNVESQAILTALQSIQSDIDKSHTQFLSMQVPSGAEQLHDAMGKFFEIESHGIQQVILGVQNLQGKESDPTARQVFTDAFAQFSSQESSALRDFYSTQQQVASKFGQKVVDTEK